jgi:hypothetical protein
MTFLRKTLALSAVLAVAVALFGSFATTASAESPPFSAYGTGATDGDTIAVLAGTTECATATATATGTWGPIQLGAAVGDCVFAAGDTISFCLNGTVADQSELWAAGGAPSDVSTGTVLTVTNSESSGSEDLFNNCGGGSSDTGSCTENCNTGETPEVGVPEVGVPEVGVPEIVVEVGVPEVVVPEVAVTVTAPAPGATGNAGLAQSTGTSSIATMLLSAFAVIVVAGGRVASRMR